MLPCVAKCQSCSALHLQLLPPNFQNSSLGGRTKYFEHLCSKCYCFTKKQYCHHHHHKQLLHDRRASRHQGHKSRRWGQTSRRWRSLCNPDSEIPLHLHDRASLCAGQWWRQATGCVHRMANHWKFCLLTRVPCWWSRTENCVIVSIFYPNVSLLPRNYFSGRW